MDRLDRLQQLHRIWVTHKFPVALSELAKRLECSERTVQRDIDFFRDQFAAPVEYCRQHKGWQYAPSADQFELPGLWLTSAELQSLALVTNLLDDLGEGVLGTELKIVEQKLNQLLEAHHISRSGFDRHIKVLPVNHRYMASKTFAKVCEALLKRYQLTAIYKSYTHQQTERTLSPQTLVYYRENWYLDAWCHLRQELRTFSLARFEQLNVVEQPAEKVPEDVLTEHFTQGYGIFSGKAKHTAKLRFYPEVAREIACQQWHPAQQGEWDGDDYLLTIPYSDPRELVQDILRHIPNVFVESPVSLRRQVQTRLHAGLELFQIKGFAAPDAEQQLDK